MVKGNEATDFPAHSFLFLTEAEVPHKNVSLTKEKVKVVPLKKGTEYICLQLAIKFVHAHHDNMPF